MIATTDWIIDPRVAAGSPEAIVKGKRRSLQPPDLIRRYTGAFLKPVLAKARRSRRERGQGQEAAERVRYLSP